MTSTFNSSIRAVRPTSIAISLFLLVALLPPAAHAAAGQQCEPVEFEEVLPANGPRDGVGVARVVLRTGGLSFDRLLCLQQSLRVAHPEWVGVTVLVFSSRRAAIRFDADTIASVGVVGAYHDDVRAVYWIGPSKDGDTLTLTPLGWELLQEGDYNTVVVFPVQPTAVCRIELNHRCVLALQRIRYPLDALRRKASGSVTVTGTITAQGAPTDMQVAAVDADGTRERDWFIQSAVENLRTWRFDPAPMDQAFRITIVFSADASLRSAYAGALPALQDRFRREGITRVEFQDGRVTVRSVLPE